MQATRRAAPASPGASAREPAHTLGAQTALRAAGATALLALLAALAVLAIDAAAAPSRYVPADSGGWPHWLAGPLSGPGEVLGKGGFQMLTLIICASYLVALVAARALPLALLAAAVVLAHVILL